MKKHLKFGALLLLVGTSCQLLDFSSLQVTAWSPNQGQLPASPQPAIWVEFNRSPDHAKTEAAFSLSQGQVKIRGDFSWTGNRLIFTPFQPLSPGPDYLLSVDNSAEDSYGASLFPQFQHRFTMGTAAARPQVTGATFVDTPRGTLTVSFDSPILPESALEGLTLSPSAELVWTWSTAQTLVLTPTNDWTPGQVYHLVLSTAVKNTGNQSLADPWDFYFTPAKTDFTPASLTDVSRSFGGTTHFTPPAGGTLATATIDQWPINADIHLTFSEPVAVSQLKSHLSVPNSVAYTLLPNDQETASQFTLKLTSPLPWGQVLGFTLTKGLSDLAGNQTASQTNFWLATNNPGWFPPELVSCTWNGVPFQDFDNVNFPAAATSGTLVLTFKQGTQTGFNQLAFFEAFSLIGSGGFVFSPGACTVSVPLATSTEATYTVTMTVGTTLPAAAGATGLANLKLSSSFADDQGNHLAHDFNLAFFAVKN